MIPIARLRFREHIRLAWTRTYPVFCCARYWEQSGRNISGNQHLSYSPSDRHLCGCPQGVLPGSGITCASTYLIHLYNDSPEDALIFLQDLSRRMSRTTLQKVCPSRVWERFRPLLTQASLFRPVAEPTQPVLGCSMWKACFTRVGSWWI